MKLGVSYNLFDGVELLEYSAANMRGSVDYISVIYQNKSNLGNMSKVDLHPILLDLKTRGLIDHIIEYVPTTISGHQNELAKRNLGLSNCAAEQCTHFMTMDVDEFYVKEEFDRAKQLVETQGYDSTACQMQTYYKTPEWAYDPPEDYFVPLIYKIDERRFNMSRPWSIAVDPTRRLEQKSIYVFNRSELQMHHMSYVRRDIRSKLSNSSASTNFRPRIENIAAYYDGWTPGKKALTAGNPDREWNLRKTENIFKIFDK